jgi:hypothetical protein
MSNILRTYSLNYVYLQKTKTIKSVAKNNFNIDMNINGMNIIRYSYTVWRIVSFKNCTTFLIHYYDFKNSQ